MMGKQEWIMRLVGTSPCIVPDQVHVEYQGRDERTVLRVLQRLLGVVCGAAGSRVRA